MKKTAVLIVASLVTFSAVSASHAFIGAGLHWGFDFSLSMDDVLDERVGIPFSPDLSLLPPGAQAAIDGVDLFKVTRENWGRTILNFGGKGYINFIPFIEALELSANFGLWQYDGGLSYVSSIGLDADGELDIGYKFADLTIAGQGLPTYLGVRGTPYAKLQLDATVRKTVLNLWIVKISGGLGASVHLATPLLTGKLIEDVLPGDVTLDKLSDVDAFFTDRATGQKIVKKIISEALGKPVVGMHIILGAKAKIPALPFGVYVDGKYMIPFTSYDEDAGKSGGVSGFGLLVNAGVLLEF